MNVSVVTVGIDEWEKYTLPLVKSIRFFEPDANIVVVDNRSEESYPASESYEIVRTPFIVSYARALNAGLAACPESGWYILINNDVKCVGPFKKHLRELKSHVLYGNQLNSTSQFGSYIEGWMFVISHDVLEKVGKFDESFRYAAFEDVDYSYRAKKKGIQVLKSDLPFVHLQAKTRFTRPEYREVYLANRRYLKEKHGFE